MTTEYLKDGPVTYSQSDAMVNLAEKWLLEYFTTFGDRRPGDLEDDFCGGRCTFVLALIGQPSAWSNTPFFPALGRLVDKGFVRCYTAEDGDIFYSLNIQVTVSGETK